MDQRFALNTYTTGAMMFQIKICIVNVEIISSPERKAQVSFPDQIRPLSLVIVFVVLVVVVIKFSYFHLLLQNHWANFNQIGTKHPWVKGIQVCSNKGSCPFPRGDNYEKVKIHWRKNLKIWFSWKLKWAFLITCRPSSVCQSV